MAFPWPPDGTLVRSSALKRSSHLTKERAFWVLPSRSSYSPNLSFFSLCSVWKEHKRLSYKGTGKRRKRTEGDGQTRRLWNWTGRTGQRPKAAEVRVPSEAQNPAALGNNRNLHGWRSLRELQNLVPGLIPNQSLHFNKSSRNFCTTSLGHMKGGDWLGCGGNLAFPLLQDDFCFQYSL